MTTDRYFQGNSEQSPLPPTLPERLCNYFNRARYSKQVSTFSNFQIFSKEAMILFSYRTNYNSLVRVRSRVRMDLTDTTNRG